MNKIFISMLIIIFSSSQITFSATQVASKDVTVNTSGFTKNLNSSDSTVQVALNTIDQLNGGGVSGINWGQIGGTITNQTDLQTQFSTKQATITTGITAQYLRGDLSLATFPTNLNQFTNGPGYITGLTWTQIGGSQSSINLSGFTNNAGFITGNQNITMTGAVTGSGTTSIATVLANLIVKSANVNWNDINRVSTINSGGVNWNDINRIATINTSGINWPSLQSSIYATGINWANFGYSSGFMKWNGSGIPLQDTNTYLTGNQNITLSGAVTGSGTTSIVTALAALFVQGSNINWPSVNALINSAAINWPNVNALGTINNGGINWADINRIANINSSGINWANINLLSPINKIGINWANFGFSSGFMKWNGSGVPTQDNNTYLTGNQTITLTGAVTGSGTTSIATTLGALNIQSSNINWPSVKTTINSVAINWPDINANATINTGAVNWNNFPTSGFAKFQGSSSPSGVASTGSGNVVLSTSPTLVTPTLGTAVATTLNGLTVSTSTGTLTIANGKTATVNNTLTLVGTDGVTMTTPTTSFTAARTDSSNIFTGHQTIEGVTSTGATGTGNFVFSSSPTIASPILTGNIGIGTTLPAGNLDVEGTLSKTIFGGNVGIGTTIPGSLFSVGKSSNGGSLTHNAFNIDLIGNITNLGGLQANINAGGINMIEENGALLFGNYDTVGTTDSVKIYTAIPTGSVSINPGGLNVNTATFTQGNLGIGTTQPQYPIDETTGTIQTGDVHYQSGTINFQDQYGMGFDPTGGGFILDLNQSRLVGINNNNPAYQLDVFGTTRVTSLLVPNNIGVGLTTPVSGLDVANITSSTTRGILSEQYSTDNISGKIIMRKSRGTVATPTTIVTGDNLGDFATQSYDGQNWDEVSRIRVSATGTVSTGIIPTIISFFTNNSSGVLTQAQTIDSNQNVGIGTTIPAGQLDIEGTLYPTIFYGHGSFHNVGIGTLTPGDTLDVQGTIRGSLGYISGTTPGVNCSGAPDSGFTVVKGIVTAC